MPKRYFKKEPSDSRVYVNRRRTDNGSSYADREEFEFELFVLTQVRRTDKVSLREDRPK